MLDAGASGLVVTNLAPLQLEKLAGDAPTPNRDEDDDIDLPEFIVGDDEDEDGTDKFDEALPDLHTDGGDPFDDANASELEVGIEIADDDGRDTSAEASDDLVDVGALDEDFAGLDHEASAIDDGNESEALFDDDAPNPFDNDSSQDDGGSEGTGEDAANDIDESALPELDESEQDHVDDALADELLEEAARSKLPPWASSRFVSLEGAGASVPCATVSITGGRVFAAGDVVLTVDEGAHAARRMGLETPCTAIAAIEEIAVLSTARGGVLISRDGCVSASPVAGFRSAKGHVDLACTPSRIWLLHDGALWSMAGADSAPVRVRDSGVVAITASSGSLVVLSSRADSYVVERFRGDDEVWQSTALSEEVAKFVSMEPRPMLVAAAAGRRVAIASSRDVWMSNDGGSSFFRVDLMGVTAACFAGEDEKAHLMVIVPGDDESLAHLIRVTEDGEPARLAEIRGIKDSGPFGETSIAWDGSRELLWIGSRHGLVAYGPARRH